MKSDTIRSLGLTLAVSVPDSVEEFDQLAARAGACLEEATNNILYRSTLAAFRENFCEALEKDTGIERATKETGKKDSKGEPVVVFDESEADYVKRVLAEKKAEITSFQPLADSTIAAIVFDPKATERKSAGPKKLPKMYLEIAQAVLDQNKGTEVATKLSNQLGFTVAPTLEGIAAAVKAQQEAKKKQMVADLVS